MVIPAGVLRDVFVLEQRPTATRNAVGEVVAGGDWQTVATVYGAYEALAYTELEQRSKVSGSIQAIVRIRYRSDVTGGMRLKWQSRGNRTLYISAVLERGNREELELTVEEQVA